ncbi:MAG: efflux RND transporter periplasmic adaptor subunit [Parcubacteria group bacterium]|jgi:RND family efflux transporter MFP subunit
MKLKLFASFIIILVIVTLAFRFSQKKTVVEDAITKNPINITTQSVKDSATFKKSIRYPAIIASDQQVNIIATASGTITKLNFDLGKKVYLGQNIITIDSRGNNSTVGENGLRSGQIQALESAVQSAEKSYKLAKENYQKTQSYANKKTREIAKINLIAAQNALNGSLDNQLLTAPITGTIIQKYISQGDSVNLGQTLATLSKTDLTKVQFFVDKNEVANLKIGSDIFITENDVTIEGKVTKIAPQADETTKRFLIEAMPNDKKPLIIGSVVTVTFDFNYSPQTAGNLILPLSAITIGQNESFIFINKNNQAQKVSVKIVRVDGEMAEIKTDITAETQIILEGNKLLQDGDKVTVKNK